MNKHKNLTYKILGGSVLDFDLHNDYRIIAIINWNFNKQNYEVTLYIKENTVDMLDLIQETENTEIKSEKSSIKLNVAKYVSDLFEKGFFDHYIKRYEYMLKCFDKGDDLLNGDDSE